MPAVHIDSPSITFLHVPRTAGTSIGIWLTKHQPTTVWFDHPTLDEIKQQHNVVFSFSVVRNPWDRMVSMYHHINALLEKSDPSMDQMKQTLLSSNQGYFQAKFSFEQFVQDLHILEIPKGIFQQNYPMATTQYDYTQGVNLVLKHETLEQNFGVIQQMLSDYTPLDVINTSEHAHYSTYYNSATRDRISVLFGDDIEQWQYQF